MPPRSCTTKGVADSAGPRPNRSPRCSAISTSSPVCNTCRIRAVNSPPVPVSATPSSCAARAAVGQPLQSFGQTSPRRSFDRVTKRYAGRETAALHELALEIPAGGSTSARTSLISIRVVHPWELEAVVPPSTKARPPQRPRPGASRPARGRIKRASSTRWISRPARSWPKPMVPPPAMRVELPVGCLSAIGLPSAGGQVKEHPHLPNVTHLSQRHLDSQRCPTPGPQPANKAHRRGKPPSAQRPQQRRRRDEPSSEFFRHRSIRATPALGDQTSIPTRNTTPLHVRGIGVAPRTRLKAGFGHSAASVTLEGVAMSPRGGSSRF
jgi:hypothetical protein